MKAKEAKSELKSGHADLSKLAMIERIFWLEVLNEFFNEWMKENTIWDVAVDGDYTIVLKENNCDVISHETKKLAILLLFIQFQ